jgi:hypothetical protein
VQEERGLRLLVRHLRLDHRDVAAVLADVSVAPAPGDDSFFDSPISQNNSPNRDTINSNMSSANISSTVAATATTTATNNPDQTTSVLKLTLVPEEEAKQAS